MSDTISFNNVTINTSVFKEYNKKAQEYLAAEQEAKDDLASLLESAETQTGIAKADLKAYFSAVYKDTWKEDSTAVKNVIDKGDLFEVLDGALK